MDPQSYEPRWRERWHADQLYEPDLGQPTEAKFYNLVEFPYPSAEGLHVGHVYTYCGADTYGRYQRMRGRQVFQPMGFDSFGIHAENYALKIGEHPASLTGRTIHNYRRQLSRLGAAWSWSASVVTSEPEYYRWTQWLFVQLFRAGLAERRTAPAIWCPSCLTVLAHEQLEGECCERCGSAVTERVLPQWFLKITRYADELLDGLDGLDWPELAKKGQRDWIGRSRGAEVDFRVEGSEEILSVFTTRPDTLFGVTFLAVPPGHELVGRRAVNPATGEAVPILAAEHVVAGYATGAVMGVPAHDQRDLDFALAGGLPVITVVEPPGPIVDRAWTGEGRLVASGAFTGMSSGRARDAMVEWLKSSGTGRPATRYRLHDWLISRQRYWGPPIPIIHCDSCGPVAVPEDQLPVLLPTVEEFRPTGTGRSPLAAVPEFVTTTCPTCRGPARRETDVSDTFLDSAWYFLRYPSSRESHAPWDPERTRSWLPVDMYAGGREHVARHHLYARFLTRALNDLGMLAFVEPFPRLRLHGLLVHEGAKMSKSRGNVVNPDEYIDRIGADNLRMYLLFCGPWEEGGDFSDKGLSGIVRFNRRLAALVLSTPPGGPGVESLQPIDAAVARVATDIERFKLNTAISALMQATNWAARVWPQLTAQQRIETGRTLLLMLAPFAPHLAEELWAQLGQPYSIHQQRWPDLRRVVPPDEFTLVIQVDGRVRAKVAAPSGLGRDEAVALALQQPAVVRHRGDGQHADVVYVPGRLINFVGRRRD